MRFGPTSLKVSSMLAKGLRRPKLRSDLRVSEQTIAAEKSYVIKVSETNSYNRYGAAEYELLTLCDGTRMPAEVAREFNQRHPDETVGERDVLDFLGSIEPAMWERSVGEKNLAVLERIRDERKGRVDRSSILYISFKGWDPNKFLDKIDPYFGWLYTSGFVAASLILFIVCAYLLAGDWTRIANDTRALYGFENKTAYDIWAFWFLLCCLGGIHELGHGLTCKHFGGEVHQMGFLLIYFTPAFFTDTTDILLFDRGSRRLWVIFAGIWVELTVCAIATLLWHFSLPGSLINDLAYKTVLLSGFQSVLVNLNPLIKADGYYALAQFLDTDNLREDSFAFLRAACRKYILREDMDLPSASRRLRRIYMVFGTTAMIYSSTLIVLAVGFVKNVFIGRFGAWGYVLAPAFIYFLARKSLQKTIRALRTWSREQKEGYMSWKSKRVQQLGAIGVAALLLMTPLPSRVSSDFTLEPGRDAHARANVAGLVREVLVHEGDHVEAGQQLATLVNPEVTAIGQVAEKQLALAGAQLRSAQERPQMVNVASPIRERNRLLQEAEVARRNEEWLEIRAPYSGVVQTRNVEQRVGEFLSAGDEFCEVVNRSVVRARILVRDWELEQVQPGAAVRMKVSPFPFRTYHGTVLQILPAAAPDRPVARPEKLERRAQQLTNYFAVIVEFPNADGSLREGMTGTAKISVRNSSLARKTGHEVWHWLRSQVW